MAKCAVGGHVDWNSEAGRALATNIKVHREDFIRAIAPAFRRP